MLEFSSAETILFIIIHIESPNNWIKLAISIKSHQAKICNFQSHITRLFTKREVLYTNKQSTATKAHAFLSQPF